MPLQTRPARIFWQDGDQVALRHAETKFVAFCSKDNVTISGNQISMEDENWNNLKWQLPKHNPELKRTGLSPITMRDRRFLTAMESLEGIQGFIKEFGNRLTKAAWIDIESKWHITRRESLFPKAVKPTSHRTH